VKPVEPYSNVVALTTETTSNNWLNIGLTFTNRLNRLPYTQALKIKFTRLQEYTGRIVARNLRVARNVS
jgi:hypothetical protein